MGRRKLETPLIRREIYLDPQVSAILETLFLNTLTGKAQYGQVNLYITGLIRQDLSRRGLLGVAKPNENKA
jgi:hypothetical protein